MSRTAICAQCEHFTRKDTAGVALPQAAHGLGRCHGYDGAVAPVEPYVRWDARPCVMYGVARDLGLRNRWIEAQQAKEPK